MKSTAKEYQLPMNKASMGTMKVQKLLRLTHTEQSQDLGELQRRFQNVGTKRRTNWRRFLTVSMCKILSGVLTAMSVSFRRRRALHVLWTARVLITRLQRRQRVFVGMRYAGGIMVISRTIWPIRCRLGLRWGLRVHLSKGQSQRRGFHWMR